MAKAINEYISRLADECVAFYAARGPYENDSPNPVFDKIPPEQWDDFEDAVNSRMEALYGSTNTAK